MHRKYLENKNNIKNSASGETKQFANLRGERENYF